MRQARVSIRIGGQDHVVRADGPQEHLEACLDIFTERITLLRRKSPGIAEQRALVLAVLSIADDLLDARRQLEEREREVEQRARNLRMRISAALEKDA